MLLKKEQKRLFRHKRIRKKISGTAQRPRLCVHRSLRNITAQVIDDDQQKVLFGMSTQDKELKGKLKSGGNVEAASQLGQIFAQKVKEKGIQKVSFDRSGYRFHGRIKAFAEAAREGGLEF